MYDLGLNPEQDPRGLMRHDGSGSIKMRILQPTPKMFNDDSKNNELGACWETEPKKHADLDLYYEASSALPLKLNQENAFDFAPINSKVHTKRQNNDGIYNVSMSNRNTRVSNIHFTDDTEDAIITIYSHTNIAADTTYE